MASTLPLYGRGVGSIPTTSTNNKNNKEIQTMEKLGDKRWALIHKKTWVCTRSFHTRAKARAVKTRNFVIFDNVKNVYVR